MEDTPVKQVKKAVKKQSIYRMVPGIADNDVKLTMWEVMAEFRDKSIEEIKHLQIVRPKEVDEILKRLQFLD